MQQEATKKNKKLVWLIAGLAALLVVVGVVLAIFLMPGSSGSETPTGPVGGRPDLYWNIDRDLYTGNAESAGLSTREPGEDGLYHLRFAINGEQVEYAIADKRLVNVIDNQDVLGLVFDNAGNVVDAINPNTIATELAKDFFVQRADAGSLSLNSSVVMNGMEMPVKLGELTQIYNVSDTAVTVGEIDEVELMDKVIVYANDKGEVTHVFIVARQPSGIVGWRVDRKQWDSTAQHSTRPKNEDGEWTIKLAVDGQHVEYKCKDQAIVDDIDKRNTYASDLAVQVDENGYITGVMEPYIALRGKLAGASYHITELNGNQFTATYLFSGKENGKSYTGTITENTKIYNVCYGGTGAYIGEPTELQEMDRVIIYTDLEGNPLVIFVNYRMVDLPVAYVKTRMWDATKLETTRVPDANGYYKFEMAVEGKLRTLRTKDKTIANFLDSKSHQMYGVELNGDIIVKAYDPHYVCGNDYYGAGGRRYIKDITGVIVSWVTVGYDFNSPTNLVLSPDAEIYDVTGYAGTKFGERTELQIGDLVRPLVDVNDNITHLYVVARHTGTPVYYNLSRQYDDAKAETKRVPNEEGYYVFDVASEGKRFTVKTKDKAIADFIDMQYAPVVSLNVDKNGIVKGAYPVDAAYKFGYKTANWNWFVGYNEDGTISTTSYSRLTNYTLKMAKDVKIYNVSSIIDDHKGEPTKKLMPNDLIQAVAVNDTQEIKEIYVITRQVESKFYYNISRKYNTVTKETTRVPDEEGYYVFDLSVEGQTKQFKTKDKAIATTIDGYGYVPFGMQVKGDVITRAFPASSVRGVNTTISSYDVTKLSSKEITVTRVLPTGTSVGDVKTLPLAANYKAYNVSSYAEPFGAKVKLGLGDRAYYITNTAGEVEWAYIWYKNTHQKGYMSYCEHCDKKVYWQPYCAASYTADAHVYVTHDGYVVSQVNISSKDVELKDRPEMVIDLNGYTLKAKGRAFLVYGTLSIVDTVGGGKILGGNTATESTQALMSSTDGVINLYSGTITRNPNNKAGTNGGVVFVGADSTFNMYGGTIEGGYAGTKGGNVYNAYGQFNMYGGKITGGLNGAGKNVFIGEGGFYMDGGVIDGDMFVESAKANVVIGGDAKINKGSDAGLQLAGGVLLNLDKVTANTKVVVDASGIFTKEYANINDYLANFSSSDSNFPVFVQGKALAGGKYAYCEHCGDYAYWGKFSTGACYGKTHLVMTEDVVMSNQLQIGTSSVKTDDVVIDLNGHTVTTETGTNKAHDTGRFALVYATLSIMDNSEAGNGKIIAAQAYNTGGVVMVATGGKLNLYGGELALADDCAGTKGGIVSVGSGTMNMYGGKLTNGRVKASATSTSAYVLGGSVSVGAGTFNMYGGEIVGGSELNPDDKILLGGNICVQGGKVNIYGGTVSNGVADLGGNIFADNNSVVNILGGEIKDGRAVVVVEESFNGETGEITTTYNCGNGGNIYADQSSVVTIGADEGNVQTLVTGGEARQGGNIYQVSKSTVNIGKLGTVSGGNGVAVDSSDEKYNGGNAYLGESANLTIRGLVTGGHAWQGGNIAANGLSTITIDGGIVSDGTIDGWNGGNIQSNNGVVKMMNKAQLLNGKANKYRGGNLYAGGGAEVYISDSTISGGSAWQGGNIFISSRTYTSGGQTLCDYGILEVTDGAVIADGTTYITDGYAGGGNICALGAKITMEGSTVENGISKSCGGNIFISNMENKAEYTSTLTMDKDSKVLGGESQITSGYNGGGNIYAAGNTVIECAGTIADGKAGRYGGNLMLSHASVTLQDGAKVENGTATAVSGGNICKFNSGSVDVLAGATISGGTAGASADSIFISGDSGNGILNVAGTITGGEVLVYNSKVDMTVSGDAKIDELTINAGVKINVGEMTENAMVKVNANGIFTNPFEKASQYAKYFDAVSDEMDVAANDANELVVGTLRYCEHCDKEVLFGSFSTGAISESTHMILTEDVLMDAQLTIGSTSNKDIEVVVDLNGYTAASNPASTSNYKRFALVYAKLFIQDSSAAKTGKIEAIPTTENAGAIMVGSTGEMTLYSGEITIAEGTAARKTAGVISVGSGKFTMNGGKISGGVVTDHASDLNYTANMGGAVYVTYGKFTMNGGEIVGGESAADATKPLHGGAIYNSAGTVIINDGTVSGGKALLGGAIYTSSTLTINGGTVTGGEALTTTTATGGGNIYAIGANVTINGGIVEKGTAKACGGNIYLTDQGTGDTARASTLTVAAGAIIRDGKVIEKTAEQNGGGNIYATGSTEMTISGTVSNGSSSRWGGNIMLIKAASLTLTDGAVVENGKASSLAGNIMAIGSGNLNIQAGAKLKGGSAIGSTVKYGSAIYLSGSTKMTLAGEIENDVTVDSSAAAKLTVSGAAKINRLILPAAEKFDLTLDNLTEGAAITVETDGAFTVANDKAAEYAKYFATTTPETKGVTAIGKVLYVGDIAACVHCGENETAVWVPYNAAHVNSSVHMKVQEAVTLKNQLVVADGADVVIDLNGQTITTEEGTNAGNDTGRFARVIGKLSILDSASGGKVVANQKKNVGGVILQAAGSEFNLYAGELSLAEGAQATKYGGIVSVSTGTFNMYGGKLSGGALVDGTGDYKQNLGASVYVPAGGTFNMYGGVIDGGKLAAEGQKNLVGGNIYALSATVRIEGGTISNGEGYIGGNIYAYGGSVTISKKAVISGGKTTSTGGSIYVEGGCALTLDDVTISGGEAAGSGGNICVTSDSVLTANKATISGGKATSNGGNIYVSGAATANITDSTISGGEAANGGNIYAATSSGKAFSTVTLNGGTMENGKAIATAKYTGGGNLYATSATVTITGTAVSNGEANQCGGNIMASGAVLTLGNGTVLTGGKINATTAATGGYLLGSSVCKFNAGKLEIQAGAVVNAGTSSQAAVFISDSTSSTGDITVAGTVNGTVDVSGTVVEITLVGDVNIRRLNVPANNLVVLSNLTENASVGVSATGVFTKDNDKAADYLAANYFTAVDTTKKVDISGKALAIVAK